MEMCYDGALVMPSSYAVMTEDEMTYVDGGYYITNTTLRGAVISFAQCYLSNPITTTMAVNVLSVAVKKAWTRICRWVGTAFGGAVGSVFGTVVGWYTGMTLASKFAMAVIGNKGLEISWNGLSVK